MKKRDFVRRYGEEAWAKKQEQSRRWNAANPIKHADGVKRSHAANPDKHRRRVKQWKRANPDKVKSFNQKYFSTGLPHSRKLVRMKHGNQYRAYKQIIAPDSQIHHEWIPNTANFRGVALVEKDQHQHGVIDVIQILEGDITLLEER